MVNNELGLKVVKWARIAIIAGVVIVGLLATPFLIPMGTYITQVEQVASQKLGVPVKIASLRLAFLPTPRLNIGGMVVGSNAELSVDKVSVVPVVSTLFSKTRVISRIQIDKPLVKKAALDILTSLPKQQNAPTEPTPVVVRHIVLKTAKLEWPDIKLPDIDADISLSDANKPKSAQITSTDGKLKLVLIPEGTKQNIKLTADQWTLPAGLPLLIDKLQMEMTLEENRLLIPTITATLYRGRVTGNAELNWGKDWRATGRVQINGLEVTEPTRLMSKSTHVSGRLSGNGTYSMSAKEPAQLADKILANFRFKVDDGVLYGLDLVKAASILLKSGQSGGETRFDELAGLLHVVGKQYELRDLKVSSGLMAAKGGVKVLPNKSLDGVIEVEVKTGVNLADIPLQVSGTLDNPQVFPTKAAMAGALAGTAVLGPGLGTSIGIKTGSAVDKIKGLFGSSDKK